MRSSPTCDPFPASSGRARARRAGCRRLPPDVHRCPATCRGRAKTWSCTSTPCNATTSRPWGSPAVQGRAVRTLRSPSTRRSSSSTMSSPTVTTAARPSGRRIDLGQERARDHRRRGGSATERPPGRPRPGGLLPAGTRSSVARVSRGPRPPAMPLRPLRPSGGTHRSRPERRGVPDGHARGPSRRGGFRQRLTVALVA